MASFKDVIDFIVNGENVDASTTNAPLQELQNNCVYLRDLLLSTIASTALYIRSVPLNPSLLVGQPVYYNAGAGYYDLALADGSAKENFVGLVASKVQANLGDIVTLGYVQLSLANALPGGTTMPAAAGRYYLSTTTAGQVTLTPPSPIVQACISDGVGDVFVIPQLRDNRGFQGYQGRRGNQGLQGIRGFQGTKGFQGFKGFQGGPPVAQPQAQALSGTSTDGFVTVLTLSGASGILGVLSVKNSGGSNGLSVQVLVTDASGNNGTSSTTNLAPGIGTVIDTHTLLASGTLPPYNTVTVQVKSQATGNSTTYVMKGSVVK